MDDDDYIMLEARIDGLREAIAAVVRSLPQPNPALDALRDLHSAMDAQPLHIGTTQEVSELLGCLADLRSL